MVGKRENSGGTRINSLLDVRERRGRRVSEAVGGSLLHMGTMSCEHQMGT